MRSFVLGAIAYIATVQGCPSADTVKDSKPASSAPAPPAASVTASLEVEVRMSPDAAPRTATLTCGEHASATGFIKDAKSACDAVARSRRRLVDGPDENRACTMIYGGPEVAHVRGTLDGAKVDAKITRTNGCGIADWRALEPLLGAAGGDAAEPPQ